MLKQYKTGHSVSEGYPSRIEVLDALMGTGKTTAIINWMKDNPQNKYLYVSPMLAEVEERIPTECASLEFVFPTTENHKTKSAHLLDLLTEGCNISFTHSLFQDLTKRHLELISKEGYVLIIDEEVGLIEPYSGTYKRGDITSLENAEHIEVDENNLGIVRWKWEDMEEDTAYSKLKRLCDLEMLYCAKRDRDIMVTQLPLALVESAHRTIVLTYLFKGSVMESFLKLRGVSIVPFTEVRLMKDPAVIKRQIKDLVNVIVTPSMTSISKLSMSVKWYSQTGTKEDLSKVGKAIHSIMRKYPKEDVIFTMPKDSTVKKRGNKANPRCAVHKSTDVDESYLYCSARATNDYAHKSVAIHAYNRFVNKAVAAYLQDYGKEIGAIPSDNQYALSEMLQWIYRTRIRNDQPIDLYIFSERMRKLFTEWLNREYEN